MSHGPRVARAWIFFFAGVVGALLVGECVMRVISMPRGGYPTPEGFEIRAYDEGFARSHFYRSGERITGNPPITGASSVVILGNSYMEAHHLRDRETMGSVLERVSRGVGRPLNVHQFGWSGESIPQYLAFAGTVEGLRPQWVAVVTHKYDLCGAPLEPGPHGWSVSIGPNLSLELHRRPITVSRPAQALQSLMNRSALLTAVVRRASEVMETRAEASAGCDSRLPTAVVRGLKNVYGRKLALVYLADVGLPADPRPDSLETAMLEACRAEDVRCVSTRAPMVEEFDRSSGVARGFHNSVIGAGHLNALGHRLLARQMWEMLYGRD